MLFRSATLTTPATITANAVATVSAQTNGSDTTQGTSTWTADPASTSIGAASDLSVTTFALPNQKITTGNSLRSQLQLPKSFLNAYFGLVTVATQTTGAASCTKCPTAYLSLSIQDSTIPAGPFSATNPFALVLTLASSEQPNGYQFSGITHDGVEIPPCATSPLDADTPMCLDSWSQRRPGADIVATVLGYQNGFIGFD